MMRPNVAPCPNFNHRRADAPVRNCPNCGDVVNAKVRAIVCTVVRHDVQRRSQSAFCVDCGEQLATVR
jgi:hypothetical protein